MDLMITKAVDSSVSVVVGDYLRPRSLSVVRSVIMVCPFWQSAPSEAFADDTTT